jgi:hypothetical protein
MMLNPFPFGSPSEWGLLLLAARAEPHPDVGRFVEEAGGGGLDWVELTRMARFHGVTGLLHNAIAGLPEYLISQEERSPLVDDHRVQARANLGMVAHLGRILDVFSSQGLQVIPLRGPVLATRAYGNVSLRTLGDLDLLVREEDLDGARGALEHAGFTPAPSYESLSPDFYRRWGNAYRYFTPDFRDLGLHWRLSDPYWRMELQEARIWEQTVVKDWMGRPLLGFSAEDQLLNLCVQGAQHAWDRLILVSDLAETLRSEDVDWVTLLARAESIGAGRMVFVGLNLARTLLDAPVPLEVRAAIRADPAVRRLAGHSRRVLMGQAVGPLAEYGYHIQSRDTVGDQLQFLAGSLLTPSTDDLHGVGIRLPAWAVRVRRPIRLARKYWGRRNRRWGGEVLGGVTP